MAEDIVKYVRGEIERAEKELEKARDLIERMRKAGENTADLEIRYRELKAKLDAYKKAFQE
mgnify:CR=1 FL=1